MNPVITAILMGLVAISCFAGGFALADWRTSPERLAKLENAVNWECKSTLIFNPRHKEEK